MFNFFYKKAAQAINFFSLKNNGEINKLRVLKLVYFADRYHLRKYGRPITNDQYWAMKFGPVASGVKDLFELDSVSHEERHYSVKFFKPGTKEHTVQSIAPVENDVFSQSDLEALDFSWQTFGHSPQIVETTHAYPEWQRHAASIEGGSTRVPMDYLDFLDDPPQGINPCYVLSEEEREARREQLKDMNNIAVLWR